VDSRRIHCLTCRERAAVRRGLCLRCLPRHRKAVTTGQASWEGLEAAGLVAPPQPAGQAWRRFRVR
jgi:hypothetical protein